MDTETLKLKLDKLIDSIYELRESLNQHETALPAEALQKLSRKVCLFCSKPIGKNDVVSRGCHDNCAQKIRRRIREKKATDEEMVAKGHWCPPLPGGRPADPNNPFAVDPSFSWRVEKESKRIKENDAAEAEIDEYIAKQAATKKASVPRKKAN